MILIKLILAHLIGDFFLQPSSWVQEKEQNKLKSPTLYLHVLIHVAILFLILWDLSKWPLVLIIGISHLIIDALKLIIQKKKTKRLFFFLDQLLHLLVLIADAGKYIGILERVLVFVFVILNHWEAVGFLITAKSVFRFGDLRESKERKLTEYILIGTLISFGIAILVGLIFQYSVPLIT